MCIYYHTVYSGLWCDALHCASFQSPHHVTCLGDFISVMYSKQIKQKGLRSIPQSVSQVWIHAWLVGHARDRPIHTSCRKLGRLRPRGELEEEQAKWVAFHFETTLSKKSKQNGLHSISRIPYARGRDKYIDNGTVYNIHISIHIQIFYMNIC